MSSDPRLCHKNNTSYLFSSAIQPSPTQNVSKIVDMFEERLEASADPVYAEYIKKYMRNQFDFYGLRAPVIKTITKEVCSQYNMKVFADPFSLIVTIL